MKFRGSAAIIAVAMSLGSGAIAQTGAQEAKSQEDNPLVLPTVNIKGEKIKRSQQDTYTSTGVITGQQIEDLGIKDMRDALKLQGNVYVAPSNNGNNGISIRGINSEGIGEPGANVRSLTTLTIDGAAQSFEGMRRGARGSWDVEQIEVLRGPQSTLQGRNSLAGAVVIKTHDPTDYWEGAARITAGERDLFSPAFMLSGPISDDFSFRISGETARGNKGITYSIPEAASLDDDEYRNTRVKLRFRPTAAPQLEMKLTVANTMDDPAVTAVSSPYFNRQLNFKPNDNYYIDFRRNDVRNRVLELSYGLSPGITVSSITTQVQTDARIGSPPLPNYFRREIRRDDDMTQEVRISYAPTDSRVSGVGGVFLGSFHADRDSTVLLTGGVPYQIIKSKTQMDNAAVFGEGRWEFVPRWKLIAGARYDTESYHQVANYQTLTAGSGADDSRLNYSAFLPKGGLIFEMSPNRSVAFTASTGYRGGFKEAGREIKPEYLKSYELAYRSVEADGRVIFNANVFYYDWRDQQITVRPGNVLIGLSANAGRSHAYGSELSLAWRPHRRIDLGASAGWLKTQIDDFRESAVGIISDVNYAGKEFPEAPRWSGAIWAVVRFDAGFFASFDLTSRSRSFATSDLANNQSFMVPGYSVAALRVGYETSRYSAVFFVQNLFGRDYISGRDLAGTTYVGDLRTAGVTLTARF